jgi:hypothetical protein
VAPTRLEPDRRRNEETIRVTIDLELSRFRASPSYELTLFDRLSVPEQETLRPYTNDPDFYGVLRAGTNGSTRIKYACRNTALLFLTLREPGPIPRYLPRVLGDEWQDTVIRLVLDGVLEIETDRTFLGGPSASHLFARAGDEPPRAATRTARLSLDALDYAAALGLPDSTSLIGRLYLFNREPASPRLRAAFAAPATIVDHLGITRAGWSLASLDGRWSLVRAASDGWFLWRSKKPRGDGDASLRVTYKLYVSPRFDALPRVFPLVADVLAKHGVGYFKVGNDLHGLLRPDKLVAYFASHDALVEVAGALTPALAGIPAQGVPFTADVAGDGMLSWGIDPPHDPETAGPFVESWRSWVTSRLASALVAAAAETKGGVDPVGFALERLALEGVDTTTWAARPALWAEARPEERSSEWT